MRTPKALPFAAALLLAALLGSRARAEEAPPAVPEAAPEPIEFTLPFPEDKGGGAAKGKALTVDYDGAGQAVLAGKVELQYKDIKLQADRVEVNLTSRVAKAEGNVILDQGPQRLTGDAATYDLEAKTGLLTNATATLDRDFFLRGSEIAKTGLATYEIKDGILTSCQGERPDWSFSLREAKVEVEGYAHIRGAAMRVKDVPVLYFPRIIWPAKRERASGLLIPQPGYSQRRGASLSLAYFLTLGRSYDTTFYADLYSKEYFGLGTEFRYRPSEGTEGLFEGYAIRDPNRDEWRWKLSLDHATTDLPFGMRGVASFRDYSDFDYLFDFERDFDRNALRSVVSKGFISGNWGPHSLNILAEDRQTIIGTTNEITQQRLPEIEYRLRPTRLGKLPVYLDVDSSLAYLNVERTAQYNGGYGRIDLFPSLSVPVLTLPFLTAKVSGGYRYTWYGDTLCRVGARDPDGGPSEDACSSGGQGFRGETLTRGIPVAGLQLVGPSFSRIFSRRIGDFGKFKHLIEPRFTYGYQGEVSKEDRDRTPLFDEVDGVGATSSLGRFSLANRVLGKPADEKKGSAREIFFFELAQNYSFDQQQPLQQLNERKNQRGPLEAQLRFDPTRTTSLKAQFVYNTLASQLTQRSFTGGLGLGRGNLGLTWFTRFAPATGEKVDDQARVWTTLNLVPQRFRLEAELGYDLKRDLLRQQRYALDYISQCFAWRLEMRERRSRSGPDERKDRDYRFLLTLKNVGTFLDVNSHQGSNGSF